MHIQLHFKVQADTGLGVGAHLAIGHSHVGGVGGVALEGSGIVKVVSSIRSALEEGRPLMFTCTSTRPGICPARPSSRF